MKRIFSLILFFLLSTFTFAQTMEHKTIEQRLSALEDKQAIKHVVDEFSILADTKEIEKQV
ncbi:hypothetical protein SAMN05421823_1275, partial [Catalinimonas alkaloidigena]